LGYSKRINLVWYCCIKHKNKDHLSGFPGGARYNPQPKGGFEQVL
jgi:hypothetical protein